MRKEKIKAFSDPDALVPAIIQDDSTGKVLMHAFMNATAFEKTIDTGLVTFFSRSRKVIWTKGETSGNHLLLKSIRIDCDGDALLIKVEPQGPTCHTGSDTCWNEQNVSSASILEELEATIARRSLAADSDSYTFSLLRQGLGRSAQKFGEEATETLIAALKEDDNQLTGEIADLMYHLLVMMHLRGLRFEQVAEVLHQRKNSRPVS